MLPSGRTWNRIQFAVVVARKSAGSHKCAPRDCQFQIETFAFPRSRRDRAGRFFHSEVATWTGVHASTGPLVSPLIAVLIRETISRSAEPASRKVVRSGPARRSAGCTTLRRSPCIPFRINYRYVGIRPPSPGARSRPGELVAGEVQQAGPPNETEAGFRDERDRACLKNLA